MTLIPVCRWQKEQEQEMWPQRALSARRVTRPTNLLRAARARLLTDVRLTAQNHSDRKGGAWQWVRVQQSRWILPRPGNVIF